MFLLNHGGYENGSKNWFDVHWISVVEKKVPKFLLCHLPWKWEFYLKKEVIFGFHMKLVFDAMAWKWLPEKLYYIMRRCSSSDDLLGGMMCWNVKQLALTKRKYMRIYITKIPFHRMWWMQWDQIEADGCCGTWFQQIPFDFELKWTRRKWNTLDLVSENHFLQFIESTHCITLFTLNSHLYLLVRG